MRQIELDLFNDIVNIYRKASMELKYKPMGFLQVLQVKGAITVAKDLIDNPKMTDYFDKLLKHNRLDLSIEALVVKDKYKDLFSAEERKICLKRLKTNGYKNK